MPEKKELDLSDYGSLSLEPSPVNRMMSTFANDFRKGKDINLGVGYVNENTIPYEWLQEAFTKVIENKEKYPYALNYGASTGSANLTASIKNYLIQKSMSGFLPETFNQKQVLIGSNGATSLLEGIAHIFKPGVVITSDPYYYIYCNFLDRLGYTVLTVPEDNQGFRTDILLEKLSGLGKEREKIRFFYVVSVSNPTSTVLSNSRRRELLAIVMNLCSQQNRTIPLIFDRAYEDLVHDSSVEKLTSLVPEDDSGIVFDIGTLSKVLAPALRIGYMVGKKGPLMQLLEQRVSDVGFSASLINQEVASYMMDTHLDQQLDRVNAGYRESSLYTGSLIQEFLGEYLEEVRGGKAGFYYYVTFKSIETVEGSDFFKYLSRQTGNVTIDANGSELRARVMYIPGEFCVHPEGDLAYVGRRQLRMSYGFEDKGRIKEALGYMRNAAEYADACKK